MKKIFKIAIIGRTNSGKSSLFNQLLKKKVAAVTKKVNTTQMTLKYTLDVGNNEWLLLDSPGVSKAISILDKILFNNILTTIEVSNIIWWVVDVKESWRNEMNILLKTIKNENKKVILIINKIDIVDKEYLLQKFNKWKEKFKFDAIVPISATKNINLKNLIIATKEMLKNSLENKKIVKTSSKKEILKEIIREQILLFTNDEIPYYTTLKINEFWNKKDGVFSNIEIIINSLSQKKIIIGKGGEKIKIIRLNAIKILEKIWDKKVTLFLNVKVIEKWYQNIKFLKELQFNWDKNE